MSELRTMHHERIVENYARDSRLEQERTNLLLAELLKELKMIREMMEVATA